MKVCQSNLFISESYLRVQNPLQGPLRGFRRVQTYRITYRLILDGHELEYRRNAFKPTLQNVIVLLPVTRKTRAHCESYGHKKARIERANKKPLCRGL